MTTGALYRPALNGTSKIDTNISEALGIEDQKSEALWMAFICK